MSTETAIHIENLSKKYHIGNKDGSLRGTLSSLFKRNKKEEFWALKDINLSINKGESIGIIGRNGAGKSTLLKILSKITYPTEGKVKLNGRVASLLEVGTGFHPELTGRENIFLNGSLLGMTRTEIRAQLEEIVEFSGIGRFIDTAVKHFSSGMYVRLAFSVAAHLNTEILLVDEVLAVGDAEFQKKCLGKMNDVVNIGKTVLFVSHDLPTLQSLCPTSIYLKNGCIYQKGKTKELITSYIGSSGINHSKSYKNSDLKSIKIDLGPALTITGEYKFCGDAIVPHLGFVIYNELNTPIFGTNPSLAKINFDKTFPKEGKVKIVINSPVLNKGLYRVSIWFGDGSGNDSLFDPEALFFRIDKSLDFSIGTVDADIIYEFI